MTNQNTSAHTRSGLNTKSSSTYTPLGRTWCTGRRNVFRRSRRAGPERVFIEGLLPRQEYVLLRKVFYRPGKKIQANLREPSAHRVCRVRKDRSRRPPCCKSAEKRRGSPQTSLKISRAPNATLFTAKTNALTLAGI